MKKFNQWQNSFSVIDWFNNLKDKQRLSFIEFDIIDFYPSITENILKKALDWAKNIVNITEEEISTIFQSKKALLFFKDQCWIKTGSEAFDVSMGSWDGAEIADLIGLYLLSQIQDITFKLGLYRDYGLGVTSLTPRLAEKEKHKVCRIFQENGFSIKINVNVTNVNFLDINLDLLTGTYRPFMKDNEKPVYVHSNSNHPRSILQNIPKSVNLRLSKISSDKNVFDLCKGPYQEALDKSGYNYKLEFDPPVTVEGNRKKNRGRRITYFNPPFSLNVASNIGRNFLKLIDEHFPKENILRKIINRNTVKISYRCMPNLKSKISKHNFRILKSQNTPQAQDGCNCRRSLGPCPFNGNCKAESLVYKAEVIDENENVATYTGLTGNSFKKRHYRHRQSFNNRKLEHDTVLSSYIWSLKDEDKSYRINWSLIGRAPKFSPITKKCRLCIKEKYHIIFQPEGASLNKRSELFSTCRHRLRDLLVNV